MNLIRQHLPDWLRPLARRVRRLLPLASSANQASPAAAIVSITDSSGLSEASAFDADYASKLNAERNTFDEQAEVHDLPEIFHYWSNKYLRPMFEQYGFSNPDQFFVNYMREAAQRTGNASPKFLSVGAGNCDTEIRVAVALKKLGMCDFTIECLELSPPMLARGQSDALEHGVGEHLRFTETDFNR